MSQRGMLNNPAKKHENLQEERLDDSVDVNMPQLRFHVQSPLQTPVGKPEKKRTRSELSQLNENGDLDISSFIDETVAKIIPKIIDEVKCSVKQAIEEMIEREWGNFGRSKIRNRLSNRFHSRANEASKRWADIEDAIRNRNAGELQQAIQLANNGNFRAHNNWFK